MTQAQESSAFDRYVSLLDQWERQALDRPDELFALSYLRGHIDLLAAQESEPGGLDQLRVQVNETLEIDHLAEADKQAILEQLTRLEQA